jgi:signal transduction histidine kinase
VVAAASKPAPGVAASFAEVQIRDTGRGIPAGEMAQIFEPLYSTKQGGTGLGLAVAERIARAHGGDIRVDSEPGRGTTMTVRVPLAADAGAAPGAGPAPAGAEASGPAAEAAVPALGAAPSSYWQ